jgi:hypothetical protein
MIFFVNSNFHFCFIIGGGQGYLRIVAPDMTDGDFVAIECEGAAPEDESRIQWFFNNRVCIDFHEISYIEKLRFFQRKKNSSK